MKTYHASERNRARRLGRLAALTGQATNPYTHNASLARVWLTAYERVTAPKWSGRYYTRGHFIRGSWRYVVPPAGARKHDVCVELALNDPRVDLERA